MTAVLVGAGWALALVVFLAVVVVLCKAAALADDMTRVLGPASSAETPDQLFVTLDPTAGPPAERRR